LKNGSADADKYKEAATQVMSQAHITKFPTDMLKAYIREVQSENPNEEKLSTLRDYVTTAVEVSQIASVEYDLIDNASNGFETMTKQSFDNYKLTTSDGRQVSLDSDEGIMFLVNKLANPANGSTALQVFFAHTGLSEKAVDLISKSVDLDSIPVATEQLGGQLTEIFGDIKSLDGQFKEFSNEKSVAYSSYKDAVKHYVQVLDKEYANKSAQEKKVYNAYKQVLAKTQNADFAKNLPADQIVPTLEKIHKLAVQKVTDSAAGGIQQLNSLSEILSTRLSAMEALKVPQDSKEESVRKQFVEKGNAAYAQLAEIITQINELLV
jgi:6-pyruvoyl-tetrahydropterin synthase